MKNIISFLILHLAIGLHAQSLQMQNNMNRIDSSFILTSDFTAKISQQIKTEKSIDLILEKANDSLYTIYVINHTTDTLKILSQDSHLFIIQEAKNQNGDWEPIEYWKHSWCGHSYRTVPLEPKGVLKTVSKVYHGRFETEIRFKLLHEDKVYFSNAIIGLANLSQFEMPSDLTDYPSYKLIETLGSYELLKRIIFLEPYGMQEFLEKEQSYLEKISALRKKSRN